MGDLKLFGKTEGQLETLINSVRVFSSDINMEFGIEKCGMTGDEERQICKERWY